MELIMVIKLTNCDTSKQITFIYILESYYNHENLYLY